MSNVGESKAVIDNKEIECLAYVQQELTLGDINASVNYRGDTAFFVSIRCGYDAVVKVLLASPVCDKERQNINGYKPLDLSLLNLYENQKYKKQSWWSILEMLLEAGAEPESLDAWVYVIRSALKSQEDEFILRFIGTVIDLSTSTKLQCLLLRILRLSQPLYEGDSFSDFLESMSVFTIKLIKSNCGKDELTKIYECLPCYMYSYWPSHRRKESLYTTLVVYLTLAGWKWTDQRDLDYMDSINPRLANWCHSLVCKPLTLMHSCRIALNSCGYGRQVINSSEIPACLRSYLKYADINPESLINPNFQFDSIEL